jgi:hypothetical protein
MAAPTQTDQVLSYMRLWGSVTPLQAMHDIGCMRLAARIKDLRDRGYRIETRTIESKNGKRYASYRLVA